jgi:hypothetical protein
MKLVYLYAGRNRHTGVRSPDSVEPMSHFDIRVEQPQQDIQPVTSARPDDDVPARRLLAHDLEPLVWDDDGEGAAPPPD